MVSPTQFAWIISLAHISYLVPHGKKLIGHISVPLARWDARKRKRGWPDCASRCWTNRSRTGLRREGDWPLCGGCDTVQLLFSQYADLGLSDFLDSPRSFFASVLLFYRIATDGPEQN